MSDVRYALASRDAGKKFCLDSHNKLKHVGHQNFRRFGKKLTNI
jgi:hypothetical protein